MIRGEVLGGSPLSRAAQAGQLDHWYPALPRDRTAWTSYYKTIISAVRHDWLDRLAPAIDARGRAAERLGRVASGRGLVITTGQQPGLFGGPLMTLNKAIAARALADALQQLLGVPVAPIFWAATDDADFDEAARVSVALPDGARELVIEATAPGGTPMARVPIGADVTAHLETLRQACGSVPHHAFLEYAAQAYRPGATVGDAYVQVLRAVLEPLEIAVLDVSHASVRAAAADTLAVAATRSADVAEAVAARSAELESAGFEPAVQEVSGLSLVFVNEHGTKRRLPISEASRFTASSDRWLSATVLLRPVLERALMPTAMYVGGPGEIAYFAQVSAVAEALQLPKPLVVPRWSATIVEPRVQEMLDDLGISMESLDDPHAVESQLARARLPRRADDALRALRVEIDAKLSALAESSGSLLPERAVEGARRSLEHRLNRLERRLVAGVKRNETDLMRTIAAVRGALLPHGARQERKLAYIPFLARYGAPLLDEMLAESAKYAVRVVAADAASMPSAAQPTARV